MKNKPVITLADSTEPKKILVIEHLFEVTKKNDEGEDETLAYIEVLEERGEKETNFTLMQIREPDGNDVGGISEEELIEEMGYEKVAHLYDDLEKIINKSGG